jgi:hypothetical protein
MSAGSAPVRFGKVRSEQFIPVHLYNRTSSYARPVVREGPILASRAAKRRERDRPMVRRRHSIEIVDVGPYLWSLARVRLSIQQRA